MPFTLTFFAAGGTITRADLNDLTRAECHFHRLTLAVGHEDKVYQRWAYDPEAATVTLTDQEHQETKIPAGRLTAVELAALRFLCAAMPLTQPTRTAAWRAHVVSQLAAMVPLFDFDLDRINGEVLAGFFRDQVVAN